MNKHVVEWSLLVVILAVLQAFEIGVISELPHFFAPISLLAIFLTYSAVTRSWFVAAGLCLFFSTFSSLASSVAPMVYISAAFVATLVCKSIVTAFTLENRRSFSYLCVLVTVLMKAWIFTISSSRGQPVSMTWYYFFHLILNSSLMFAIGWFMFPMLIKWDEMFGHEAEDARELRPGL
ncbi:MAG TPA: hypothetical protein VM901_00830 [Bdellovibrionota bacterium]|jgi:hypothetical protein|nr:hypothetical protein [Bdellovibrionota bacterium]